MPAIHRNRVIYQSEALFLSPDATGYHYTGKEGLGLMTPANHADEIVGGQLGEHLCGWHPLDGMATWPDWNGECISDAIASVFNGPVEVENALGDVAFPIPSIVGQIGLFSNGIFITGDDVSTVDQLIAANNLIAGGPQIGVATLGGSYILDAGVVVGSNGGLDEVPATFNSPVTITGRPVDQNLQLNALPGQGVNGNLISLTQVANGILTIAELINNWNNAPANVGNQVALTPGSPTIGTGVIAEGTYTLTGGVDAVQATATAPNSAIRNGQLPVGLLAQWPGITGNVTITGNGVDNVDTLVLAWNVANPLNKITVTDGFLHVPDDLVKITLTGGYSPLACSHGTVIKQLKRVQSVNYGFTVNRVDINQFGHLSRLDSIVTEQPTVNMDFTYFLIDGENERLLEFNVDGATNSLSGALSPELYQAGNNFFLLTVPESRDAIQGDIRLDNEAGFGSTSKTVIALGNGFITDYNVEVAVGSIPTASVTIEGMNLQSDIGETGLNLPAINLTDGSKVSDAWVYDEANSQLPNPNENSCTGLYSLPAAQTGYTGCNDIAALRPGDVVVDIQNASLISITNSGDSTVPQKGTAHIQSCSLNIPMSRTTLQRLGNTFGFSKSIDVPITATMNVSASLADVKRGSVADLLCACETVDLTVTIYPPECVACNLKTGDPAMIFSVKGARLESENFSSSLGDNKTVDMTFTVQVGGADDARNGVFISGYTAAQNSHGGIPPAWTGMGGAVNIPVHGSDGALSNSAAAMIAANTDGNIQALGYRA